MAAERQPDVRYPAEGEVGVQVGRSPSVEIPSELGGLRKRLHDPVRLEPRHGHLVGSRRHRVHELRIDHADRAQDRGGLLPAPVELTDHEHLEEPPHELSGIHSRREGAGRTRRDVLDPGDQLGEGEREASGGRFERLVARVLGCSVVEDGCEQFVERPEQLRGRLGEIPDHRGRRPELVTELAEQSEDGVVALRDREQCGLERLRDDSRDLGERVVGAHGRTLGEVETTLPSSSNRPGMWDASALSGVSVVVT